MSNSSYAQIILDISDHFVVYTSIIILAMGLIGNILNIMIFTGLRMFRGNQSAFYIVVASFADCIILLFECLTRIQYRAYRYDLTLISLFWCKVRAMLYHTSILISLTTVCFSSLDQYLSTHHRYGMRQRSTLRLAQCLTSINIGFWTLHSILFGIFYEIQSPIGCSSFNQGFRRYFSLGYLVILRGLLPLITSVVFSALSYQNVRRIVRRQIPIVRRKLDQQLTAMVLTRVVFLFIVSIPYGLQFIYNWNTSDRTDNLVRIAVEQLVIDVTSTIFFFNYAVCIALLMQ